MKKLMCEMKVWIRWWRDGLVCMTPGHAPCPEPHKLGMGRREDQKFRTSLDYMKLCLKTKTFNTSPVFPFRRKLPGS